MNDLFEKAHFKKSSKSVPGGMCVEVAKVAGRIGVRDSKAGAGSHVLSFTPDEWTAFVAGVKAGEFD